MVKLFKRVTFLLEQKDKIKIFYIFVLSMINAFLEILGIGLVIPFVKILTSEQLFIDYPFLNNIFSSSTNISQTEIILYGMIFLLLIFFIKMIFISSLMWVIENFRLQIRTKYSTKLFSNYIFKPYIFHLSRNSAELLRNCTTVADTFVNSITSILMLFMELIMLFGVIVFLTIYQPLGSISLLIIFGSFGYIYYKFNRTKLTSWAKKALFHDKQKVKTIQESFGSVKEMKLFGIEQSFIEKFKDHIYAEFSTARLTNFYQNLPRYILEFLAIFAIFVLFIILFIQNVGQTNFLVVLAVFGAAAVKLMPSANRVIFSFQSLRHSQPSIDLYFHDIQSDTEYKTDKNELNKINFKDKIELKNITFRYKDDQKDVLNNINLEVPIGSSVGIVGHSGGGKTTLIDIFLGLLKPQKGKILVDGVDVLENLKSFQSLIGYVPQDIYLLDDSLKRNIALGKKEDEIDNEMVMETIQISQLDDAVNKLSNGINSNVGERGSKFSGGEKQRIGIARSLYNKPKILVLDEATSSLDIETEKNFINSIYKLKGDKTILIISHRESTLQNCDIVYEISQGKLNLKRKK